MSAPNSRKRAAPGASPVVPMQQKQMQQPYITGNVPADQLMRWNMAGEGQGFPSGTSYDFLQNPTQVPQGSVPQASPSNSLARRQANHALIPTNVSYNTSVEPWSDVGNDASLVPHEQNENLTSQDNIEVLEEMAQSVKMEAQAKRKQIPPFVQKLSSFLEERKNEDLIRWSERGDSFIVLDEDEFAKTLIPELFKHNNYASFVRQLNMYGFHKRVGLSDNSMRASERKNKSPSEYSNPFFRRGHPNLLWLINKPKSKSKKGQKGLDGEGDSDEEAAQDDVPAQGLGAANQQNPRQPLPSVESPPLRKKEITLIRQELNKIRDQQKMILGAINRLQRNNDDLYSQVLMFQSQHDRHQNSINAILNFLANMFRKTLEDQGGSQNVGDIISSMITSQGQQSSHAGNVVDLGDFFQNQTDRTSPTGGLPKKARGLLPPIPGYHNDSNIAANNSARIQHGRVQTAHSPSPAGATSQYYSNAQHLEPGHVTELADGQSGETPPSLRQELENNPHERMMKIINEHNATNTSGLDLPEAAELVANAPNALNNDQKSKFVKFMAQSSPNEASPVPGLMDPQGHSPSAPPNVADHNAAPSLSPIIRSPPMQPPSLNDISNDQADLERLQRLQSDQDAKISELGELLGPLSPSGHIPGLSERGEHPFFDQNNVDLEQYLNSNAFLNDASFDSDGNDFNFSLNDGDDVTHAGNSGFQSGQVFGSGNNNTPSPTGTEEITRDDFSTDENGSASKRRRVR